MFSVSLQKKYKGKYKQHNVKKVREDMSVCPLDNYRNK